MEKEKSCGAIVFRKQKDKVLYLLLYKKAHEKYRESWDFPKGNVEEGESEEDVARREVKEEAGLDVSFVKGFHEVIHFFYRREGKLISKEVIFLLAETKQEKVKISFEHDDCKWASYEETIKLLTFKNSQDTLKKANVFLKEKLKQKTLL